MAHYIIIVVVISKENITAWGKKEIETKYPNIRLQDRTYLILSNNKKIEFEIYNREDLVNV